MTNTTATEYITRNLNADESEALMSSLHLALGKSHLVDAALIAIVKAGCGIFIATEA